MARRRIESRQGIAGVRVLDGDIGQMEVARGIGVLAGQASEFAFEGLARRRVSEATTDARNAELQRDERGNLISAPKVGNAEFPSIYSEHYNALLQKRFLDELGAQSAERLAEYHNRFPEDPEGFRIAAEAYSEEALKNVSDDAYEVAKAVINTTASQHFTRIAQARAERTWNETRAVSIESVERVTNDIFQNAATGEPNDPAMLDQHAMLMSLLEGNLQFMEEAQGFDRTQTNAIRDHAHRLAALGRIQAEAKPLFRDAIEVADIDAIGAKAVLEAHKQLDNDMLTLFGGQQEALKAIDNVIEIAGMERKTELHLRDRAEANLFNNVMRDVQTSMGLALRTQEVDPMMYAFLAMDPQQFRSPAMRAKMLEMRQGGIDLAHGMTRLFSTKESLTHVLERAAEVAAAQVQTIADRVGVPLKRDDTGKITEDFPASMHQSIEGLTTINHKLRQLMAALDLSGGSEDVDDVMQHLILMRGLAQDAMNMIGMTDEDMNRAMAGEPDAVAKLTQVGDYVANNLAPHNWTERDRESLSNHVDARILEGVLQAPAGSLNDQPHLFEMLFKADPAGAERAIRTYADIGMVSQGAKEFIDSVGNMLAGGTEVVSPQNVAMAMRLFGILKTKPGSLDKTYAPNDPLRAGFDRLWERGIRGEFTGQGFALRGASAAQAQQLFEGRFETDEASALVAAGMDPKTNSMAGFVSLLKDRMQAGPLARNLRFPIWGVAEVNVGYGPDLIPRAQQAALAAAAAGNFNERAWLNEHIENNFEQLGYGLTSLVATGWSRGRPQWLVHNAPALVLRNDSSRLNPVPIERHARNILEQRFRAAYPGAEVKADQIFLSGIHERPEPYTNPAGRSGLVREDRTMVGQAYMLDDQGQHFPLIDANGLPVIVNINEMMEQAALKHIKEINDFAQVWRADFRERHFEMTGSQWPE